MSNKPIMKKINLLLPVAVVVLATALFFVYSGKNKDKSEANESANTASSQVETADSSTITINDNGDVVIQTDDITENASFYEYDYNGTTIGLFAVKASDGTVRTALNTCQVCNGSPYAYFEQQSDNFQCQNCGNMFSLDMIGQERGGCNPIPIIGDERTESEGSITIPAKFLEENATIFSNWKNF